jgi:hypothetical protein
VLCLQLKDYVEKVLQLEAGKDALELQLESLKHQQQQNQQQDPQQQQHAVYKASRLGTSSSSSSSSSDAGLVKEQELFELRLQKEQAVAAVVRLKQQLLDLFGADTDRSSGMHSTLEAAAGLLGSSGGSRPLDTGTEIGSSRLGSAAGGIDAASTHSSSASGAALGGTNRMRRSAAGSAAGSGANSAAGKLSGREAELLTTVANLKAALERAMACSTPNTRFMQVSAVMRSRLDGCAAHDLAVCLLDTARLAVRFLSMAYGQAWCASAWCASAQPVCTVRCRSNASLSPRTRTASILSWPWLLSTFSLMLLMCAGGAAAQSSTGRVRPPQSRA